MHACVCGVRQRGPTPCRPLPAPACDARQPLAPLFLERPFSRCPPRPPPWPRPVRSPPGRRACGLHGHAAPEQLPRQRREARGCRAGGRAAAPRVRVSARVYTCACVPARVGVCASVWARMQGRARGRSHNSPLAPSQTHPQVRLSKMVARVTGRTAQELEPLHDYLGFMPVGGPGGVAQPFGGLGCWHEGWRGAGVQFMPVGGAHSRAGGWGAAFEGMGRWQGVKEGALLCASALGAHPRRRSPLPPRAPHSPGGPARPDVPRARAGDAAHAGGRPGGAAKGAGRPAGGGGGGGRVGGGGGGQRELPGRRACGGFSWAPRGRQPVAP